MKKKYELTDETLEWGTHILHRIKALKEFAEVKKGDLGGWVESEYNLSQDGTCWVYDDAKVFENARISLDAIIYNNAQVFGNARVYGNAVVCSTAKVYDNAKVSDNAEVYGNAEIGGNSEIKSEKDYITFKNNWSSYRWFTWTKSNNMWKVGCFYGTGEELIKKAYKDSEESGKCYEIIVKATEKIQE